MILSIECELNNLIKRWQKSLEQARHNMYIFDVLEDDEGRLTCFGCLRTYDKNIQEIKKLIEKLR